jgi:Ca-activated chloride channel family protein
MILRDSPHRGSATLDGVLELGEEGRGADREGYRNEFLKLVREAKALRGQ